jgi:Protein of unknown function (DUF3455)
MTKLYALVMYLTALLAVVSAFPAPPSHNGGGRGDNVAKGGGKTTDEKTTSGKTTTASTTESTNAKPNVALFKLPTAITPSGVTLDSVFAGKGIHSLDPLTPGTQNYTCDAATGTFFTNNTAKATLTEVTCDFTGNTETTGSCPGAATIQHFFVPSPNDPSTIVAKFQEGSSFIDCTKTAAVANADPAKNVAAVLLTNVAGSLAKNVVRTNVVGGGVAATQKCTAGQTLAVPYTANYLFFS